MEKFFLYGGADKIPIYSCSLFMPNKTFDQWHEEGASNPAFGLFCTIFGFITIVSYMSYMFYMVLYTLELTAIARSDLMKSPCYTLMLYLGVTDYIAVICVGLISGYLFIFKISYCMYPNIIFITGAVSVAAWGGSCVTCLLLVASRTLDISHRLRAESLLNRKTTTISLVLPMGYFLASLFFNKPVVFVSQMPYNSWYFDPFLNDNSQDYVNLWATFTNCGIVGIIVCLYVYMSYVIRFKMTSEKMSSSQKSILLQSVVVGAANLGCGLLYMSTMWIRVPREDIYIIENIAHVFWLAAHSVPAYVYIFVNKSVRVQVMRLLHLGKKNKSKTSFVTPVIPAIRSK